MTKILLVEDDKSLREIYGVRLLAEGYDIVSAGDGEQALAMAIKERPQLIVSDVMMPKISGFDMLDILRSTTETKDIKVIMMTALSSEDQRARGEALGADRYLVKSQVGIEDVVRTVHDVLADAPVAGNSAAQAFGSSTPSVAPRPTPSMPPRPSAATPPSAQPQTVPHAPEPPVAPSPSVPPIVAPPRAAAGGQQFSPPSRPTPPPSNSSMPQPTAPFSTNRPTGLGERIIHPISQPASGPSDLGSLMDQELQGAAATQPQTPPAAPPTPVAAPPLQPPDAPPVPPTSQPAAFQQPTASPIAPPSPPVQTAQDPDITFEETPRSNTFTPSAQPPTAR
jgi:CheY-like chemotaxis protein